MILIGIDGLQVARYEYLRGAGQLPNFSELVAGTGWSGSAAITGHAQTVTAAGNAELHSGVGSSLTGITDNSCGRSIPAGLSTFERIRNFNSGIRLGSVYGKGTCYIPNAVLNNAKPSVDWWQDRTTYPQRDYVTTVCADSRDTATKALEFINAHKAEDFYLVVYFGVPDCAGHAYGNPSTEYDDAVKNADAGLGIILDELNRLGLSTGILISADHGWNTGTTGHGTANADTINIPLVTNQSNLIQTVYSQGKRKQCDIAPTILNYFGMSPTDYNAITTFGCGSMLAAPAPVAHPADTNNDYLMALNEATKYSACWKNSAAFVDCPAGIAIDYAVRAGTLWSSSVSGLYQYNSATSCPLCWEVKP